MRNVPQTCCIGVDRVSVSIDSIDPEVHDSFRKKKGSGSGRSERWNILKTRA